jgi:hypothetical protein
MAQFYKEFKPNIKNAIAVNDFLGDWDSLIIVINRLDDNFRKKD